MFTIFDLFFNAYVASLGLGFTIWVVSLVIIAGIELVTKD